VSNNEQFTIHWLAARLRALDAPLRARRYCVALSGGLDSSVLLAALAALRDRCGFSLRALHVDHGLQPQSGRWAAAARAQAASLRVRCQVLRLRLAPRRGESLEARAREARYGALCGRLAPDERLLTAHHQDDQLETLLLALLRGSGLRGLAAMEPCTFIGEHRLLRPLLPVSRLQLQQFARRRHLRWSEDLSNQDERFDRNYLRLQVLPRLRARWPAVAATASRSAAHLSEAQQLLEAGARLAAARAADGTALRISALRCLPLPERRGVLRHWIAARGLPLPDHRRLREIAGPMLAAREDALPRVQWAGGELRRHGDLLCAFDPGKASAPGAVARWDWRRQPWLALGSGAMLGLIADRHGNVDLSALPCPLRVDFRRGGERLREAHGRVRLKDLLQLQDISPWERSAVPLLRAQRRIIAVADLWLEARFRAETCAATSRGRFRWRNGAAGG
jgi:tRNA(Ile)-lysidine synthase